jgi:NADH-quinone oxidoreductase subunit N
MTFPIELQIAGPEVILAIGALALLVVGAFRGDRSTGLVSALSGVVLIAAALDAAYAPVGLIFRGGFISDQASAFSKVAIYLMSAVAIFLGERWLTRLKSSRFEYPVLILLAALGMGMMVSAGDLISLYIGVELQSLALYVLTAFRRDDAKASEAALKYFVLGALSSGILLYGASLIYGFAGSTRFADIAHAVQGQGNTGLIFGVVFLACGLAFKVSAAPFHMWTPDVYEGAPTPITAYFATAAKVAALCLFLRAILTPFPDLIHQWRQIIIFISILSMALGAVAAIGQTNIKRLMAYSSIGHMGYALLGLAAGSSLGVRGVLIYLAIYVFTNLGVFAAIQAMQRGGKAVESISDLAGLARTNMKLAVIFSMLFLSLAGLPPLAGFFAKFYVFLAAMQAGLIWPAVIGVLTSAIGLVYYLRLVKVMFFDEPAPGFDAVSGFGSKAILALSAVVALLFIFAASPIITAADTAARSLLP